MRRHLRMLVWFAIVGFIEFLPMGIVCYGLGVPLTSGWVAYIAILWIIGIEKALNK